MIKILLADDHPVVRAGLRAVLQTESDLQVVAEAGTAAEAVELSTTLRAAGDLDVVLMDLQFGQDMTGAAATRRITALPDRPQVLILTTYDTDADILAGVEAGASGYLLKDTPTEELLAAVRSAAAGRSALAPSVASRRMERLRTPDRRLSAREIEVLRHVAEGRSNQEVARKLFISEATVKSHLGHIFDKLHVESRSGAVAAASRQGLIRH